MRGPALPERRVFLQRGLVGGALLAVAGAVPIALRSSQLGSPPREPLRFLSAGEYAVFAAVAARMVPGPGATAAWPTAEALDCAGKADRLLARAHPQVGKEFKQLLRLFENGLVGLVMTGRPGDAVPFTRLAPDRQDARLDRWRHASLEVLRIGYRALAQLAAATYYSSPPVYALLGYPGPPQVPQE